MFNDNIFKLYKPLFIKYCIKCKPIIYDLLMSHGDF